MFSFTPLPVYNGERLQCAVRVGGCTSHSEVRMFWAIAKYSCSYQNRNPNFAARRISTVLSFIIIVITSLKLTVLDLKALALNNESYIIYGAKEPV
jgi:hypothetical protein